MMIQTIYISLFTILFCASSWSAQLQMNTQTGKKGDIVTFTVFVHDAPDPVNAFGFEVTYDPTSIIFKSVQRGALLSNGFSFFQASNVGFGKIRVGGIETGDQIIPKQADGSLVLIQFNVLGETNSAVRLQNLKDDLKTWTTQHGQMIIQTQESDTEDDDILTGDPSTEIHTDDISPETDSTNNDSFIEVTDSGIQDNSQESGVRTKHVYMAANDDRAQTISANRTESINKIHNQQIAQDEPEQRIKDQKRAANQKVAQQVASNQKNHLTDKSNLKKQKKPIDTNYPEPKTELRISHHDSTTETLLNNEWGQTKPVGLNARQIQNPACSQNYMYTFPSFLTGTLILMMIVQMGILFMLFLIYRHLSKGDRR